MWKRASARLPRRLPGLRQLRPLVGDDPISDLHARIARRLRESGARLRLPAEFATVNHVDITIGTKLGSRRPAPILNGCLHATVGTRLLEPALFFDARRSDVERCGYSHGRSAKKTITRARCNCALPACAKDVADAGFPSKPPRPGLDQFLHCRPADGFRDIRCLLPSQSRMVTGRCRCWTA